MASLKKGMTRREAAEFFQVGTASIDRWTALKKATGGLEPRAHGGGRGRAIDGAEDQVLKTLIDEKPDRTYAELTHLLTERLARTFSASAVVRAVKRLGLTLKKSVSRPRSRTGKTSRSAESRF
jgi:transposase